MVVVVPVDVEDVVSELRELSGSEERAVQDDRRRPQLLVAVLVDVEVEHESDEATGEPRSGASKHGEARAAQLRATFEVEDTERRADRRVVARLKREARALSHGRDDGIVGFAFAHRGRRMRNVRELLGAGIEVVKKRLELGFAFFDLRTERLELAARLGELVARFVERCHPLARVVALRAHGLNLAECHAATLCELRNLRDRGVVHAAVSKRAPDRVELFGELMQVQHRRPIARPPW